MIVALLLANVCNINFDNTSWLEIMRKIFFSILSAAIITDISFVYANWNSAYSFQSANNKSVKLAQADMIEKSENDYYDNIGKNVQNVGSVNTYNQQGLFSNINADANSTVNSKLVQTTSVGSEVNSTNNINNYSSGNVSVDNKSSSESSDGSVKIDEK